MSDIVERLWDSDDASTLTNEAAREIESLRQQLAIAKEATRKMHRRSQVAEATHQCAVDTLSGWHDYLRKTARRPRRSERWLFRWAIDDIAKKAEKVSRAMKDGGAE